MKLNQLLAILQPLKTSTQKAQTAIYHMAQKAPLFQGLSRTYQPLDDGGYVYPAESKPVQMQAQVLILTFIAETTELLDLCATQDYANTEAKAPVIVDGVEILSDVPVPYLLFLEKKLEDIKTFITHLPVLDLDQEWHYDENRGVYATEIKQTAKTKKITKPVVLYEATKEHPAQVKEVTEDIIEGTWSLTNFSGALPEVRVRDLLMRVAKLSSAVAIAREEANSIEVSQEEVAEKLFNYLFV